MSHYSSSGRYSSPPRDSRRHGSSRRSSPGSSRRRNRSSSPGPSSRGRSPPRDPKNLPTSFGRMQHSAEEDDKNVLQRMKFSFINGPLDDLNRSIEEKRKLKVWTRNFKEIRGIFTGYLIAFDKHWNLIMSDIDEVYLKPPKCKTPFLRDVQPDEEIEEMKPKVPKEKTAAQPSTSTANPPEASSASEAEGGDNKPEKKKRRKKKKKGPTTERVHVNKVFVRGDNIVMVAVLDETANEEDRDGTP